MKVRHRVLTAGFTVVAAAGLLVLPTTSSQAVPGCAPTYLPYISGDDESHTPIGVNRAHDILTRVSGDGYLQVWHPDGTVEVVNPYDGSGWHTETGTLQPDGSVVGHVFWTDEEILPNRGFAWDSNGFKLLRLAGALGSKARDANASGTIVGELTGQRTRAAQWSSPTAKPKLLPRVPGHAVSSAWEIRRNGTITGQAWNLEGVTRIDQAWVQWRDGKVKIRRMPTGFVAREFAGDYVGGHMRRTDQSVYPAVFGPDGLYVPELPEGGSGSASEVTTAGRFAGSWTSADRNDRIYFIGAYGGPIRTDIPQAAPIGDIKEFDSLTVAFEDFTIGTCLQP